MLWEWRKCKVFAPPVLANGKIDSFRVKTGVGSSFFETKTLLISMFNLKSI